MEDRIKEMLKELGNAINEAISASEDVNDRIQQLRDEGYELYVNLDATIGLNRIGGDESPTGDVEEPRPEPIPEQVQFRINVNDLALLRALGIDPTRKVKTTRRVEPLTQ